VVWSLRLERAAELIVAEPARFLAALQDAVGARAGRFIAVYERAQAPLALRVRASRGSGREVYVGHAAQTRHPVAGPGRNVGLRDGGALAQGLQGAGDPGEASVLQRYVAQRRLDAAAAVSATEVLARGFLGTNTLARAARGIALTSFDILPPVRRFFARRMIFGPSALP